VAEDDRSGAEEVVDEAARGRSARTPALVIGGVATTIGIVFAIVVAIALALYLFL
jgi:putative exporter of polyketide antibiotics